MAQEKRPKIIDYYLRKNNEWLEKPEPIYADDE